LLAQSCPRVESTAGRVGSGRAGSDVEVTTFFAHWCNK